MPKSFHAPDPSTRRYQYGAEVVRRINQGRAPSHAAPDPAEEFQAAASALGAPSALTFQAFAESPEPDPAPVENDQGEPDPQGDSAANQKEN